MPDTQPCPITIFDTTLRDGEQSPGCSMNLTEKMEIAQALVDLGVDIIEAGFPIASPGDFEAVREIAGTIRGSTICGLARCNDADIDRAWEALKKAPKSRIHVFLATSAIHREFKLKMTREEIVARAVAGVKRAVSYCDNVEFSPEDAARTERDFLCRGHNRQHSRHRGLHHTAGIRGDDRDAQESRPQHRQGRDQHALPHRSGIGRGQQLGRRRERRGPD